MNHNPRLVCLTFDYPPMSGGVARYLSDLVEASQGAIEVVVPLEHPRSPLIPLEKGGGLERVKFYWAFWPEWLPLIKRCLEIPKDKVILVSHVLPVGTAAWISKVFGGPEYIVLFHGTDLKRINSRWKKFLLNRICNKAKLLIANSQATAQGLKRLFSTAEALVLTPGLKPFVARRRPEGSGPAGSSHLVAREELGVSRDAKVILSVARLVERKGIDTLIAAAPEILQKHPNTVFVVIGNGPYAQALESLAKLNGVPVRWIKDASDEDVRKWYAAADVFCLPAREQADDVEGFGIVFLEAAYAGLPVIAGKGWGTSEAIIDGETGYLIAPTADQVASKIIKLLDEPELAQRMGEAGRVRVDRDFKWEDRWIKLTDTLYSSRCHFEGSRVPALSERKLMRVEREKSYAKKAVENSSYGDLSTTVEMTTENDIAVVIPCYNNAHELETTLNALALQTLLPTEVVVVDNGSDDDPATVVERFVSRLPVRCIRYEIEQSATAARNFGFGLTKSSLILFLDADTSLIPRALEKMRNVLDANPQIAMAYGNFYWGRILFRGQPWNVESLQRKNWIHTSALIRRVAVENVLNAKGQGPFDLDLKKFQDWDLWLTLSAKGYSGVWINETLFSVTQQKNGISHWLPSFVHKLPWPILGWTPREIKRYREAEAIIRKKHHLNTNSYIRSDL